MGMSSVKQGMQFGWNVKNYAQNLLIIPRSTWKGVNQQSTQRGSAEVEICRWGGRGLINSQLRGNLQRLKSVVGEGVDQQSTQRGSAEVEICRWGG